jgi:hypothetical protein
MMDEEDGVTQVRKRKKDKDSQVEKEANNISAYLKNQRRSIATHLSSIK